MGITVVVAKFAPGCTQNKKKGAIAYTLQNETILFWSSQINTKPIGNFKTESGEVKDFVNQIFVCNTQKTPEEVLKICQKIEKDFGRERDNALLEKGEIKNGDKIYTSRTATTPKASGLLGVSFATFLRRS